MKKLITIASLFIACCGSLFAAGPKPVIACPATASALEKYAAAELQRYIYLATGVKPEIQSERPRKGTPCFVLEQKTDAKNPQGYSLKRSGQTLSITGGSKEGVLYGVYGLIEDHYGVSFSLGGDVLPESKLPLLPETLDETKTPAVEIRGFAPWTIYPQGATFFSWRDWKSVIDQTAKMRMNFIQFHNYNGDGGHNEMFHNFELNGKMSRTWMTTAASGHGWGGPAWDVNQYRFGAADLFDDYDFGADCTLHNESLDNRQTFRKGASLFQKVIAYAHARGVKIGLGLDIDLILDPKKQKAYVPAVKPDTTYGDAKPSDDAVVAARVAQISQDYPDLDYLLCYQSETIAANNAKLKEWMRIFTQFYQHMKKNAPGMRLAVSGWGISAWTLAQCPPDVICAPIASYSDKCDSGASYPRREYWGSPWLEKDGKSSEYYYPYNANLSNTIGSWQKRAPNMKGFCPVTWRIADAVDAKMSWAARAPWDSENRLPSAKAVYRDYAEKNYGAKAADAITAIINQNEPVAIVCGECMITPHFTKNKKNGRFMDGLAAYAGEAAKQQNVLFGGMDQHAKAVAQLAEIDRCIADATPMQRARLGLLRCRIAAARDHIALNHQFEDEKSAGRIEELMRSWVRNFTHRATDITSLGNVESIENRYVLLNYLPKEKSFPPAPPLPSDTPLHPVVISPPSSAGTGQSAPLMVRVLDARDQARVGAVLHWREAGTQAWNDAPMARKVRAIFTGSVPAKGLVEYFITVAEDGRTARFPVEGNLTLVSTGEARPAPQTPANLREDQGALAWDAAPGAFWYRIHRDGQLLTYVEAGTRKFKDLAPGFDGKPLAGTHAYQVTAVDKDENESGPSGEVRVAYPDGKPVPR